MFLRSLDLELTFVEAIIRPPRLEDGAVSSRLLLHIFFKYPEDSVNKSESSDRRWAVAMFPPTKLASGAEVGRVGSACDFHGPSDEVTSSAVDVSVTERRDYTLIRGSEPPNDFGIWSVADGRAVCLELPLADPVVTAAESQYLVSPPRLGERSTHDGVFTLQSGGVHYEENWPERYRFMIEGNDPGDVISSSGDMAEPIDGYDWVWESRWGLVAQASVTRPSAQAVQQTQSFIAGILISLTIALLLWAAEITFGPDRKALWNWTRSNSNAKTEAIRNGSKNPGA